MAQYYDYVTSTGLIVPSTSEIKTDVENEFKNNFGNDLDVSSSTPQGRLIEIETDSRVNTIGICALTANQINIDYATGQFLDAIGAFYGVPRIGDTQTSTLATVTGVSQTVIPANSIVKTDAGDEFYIVNNTTIPDEGSTTTYVLAQKTGPIPCAVGTLNTIVSQVIGWETISNPAAATLGADMEDDFNYRKRIKASRFFGLSLIESIKANLNLVANLKSSFVYDNGTNSSVVYDGVTIPAHSILVVADGGTDQDVAEAIFKKKSSGSGYTSISGQAVTVNVTDGAYGVEYPVTFNRPDVIDFEIEIQVRNNNYTGGNLVQDVKDAILNWSVGGIQEVDGLKIGQSVSSYEIGAAVSSQIPSLYVKQCLISVLGGTPAYGELDCTISQIYSISEENITVTVV